MKRVINTKPLLVFGTADFADIVTNLIENSLKSEIAAYVLDDNYIEEYPLKYNNKPIVRTSDVYRLYPPNEYDITIGFIGTKMFKVRAEKLQLFKNLGYDLPNLIHQTSVISTYQMGYGNIILENCVISYGTNFGNGNIMWPNSSINHHNIVGNYNNISPSVSTSGGVIIGNNCFLGNNSTYKNKVIVADYSFIGAGSYISKNTDKFGVYVPQRTVKLEGKTSFDFK